MAVPFGNSISGRRALITGGSTGIGAAIATALASAGADVAINYLGNAEIADRLAAEIAKRGTRIQSVQADVSKPAEVAAMFAHLDRQFGGVDILVNCAGIDGHPARAWEIAEDAWRSVIEVNLFGAFYCAQEALKRMVPAKRGVVINISSVHENIPWAGYSAYTVSKAGLSMLTKTLAQEAAPHGVRVLAVGPGAIKTPINHAVWSMPAGLTDLESKIPMGRMGDPAEVAQVVVFLATDQASYITGTTVFVDGGMLDYASFAHGG